MNGSEAVVAILGEMGTDTVFGLCGDTSLPLYEAFLANAGTLRHVLTRDERSASFMADAYARLSGRVGVCEAPSGGGATYILPGVVEADGSSVPLVCLTSDISDHDLGRFTLTELDQQSIFRPVTRATLSPSSADDVPRVMRRAFAAATAAGMGAAHVRLPLNVLEGSIQREFIQG